MTKREMESKVAELLLEQKKLKRLDLELPPAKLLLLQRLLYRLGWTNMSKKDKPIKYQHTYVYGYWLSPEGEKHDITNYRGDHSRWMRSNHDMDMDEAFNKGWHRVIVEHGKKTWVQNPFTPLTSKQKDTVSGIAIQHSTPDLMVNSKPTKFSKKKNKPIKYAQLEKNRDKPHALIEGFPIAHLLYKMANDPKNGKNIRSISKHIYKTGDSSALWELYNLIQNPKEHNYGHEHPVIKAGYNLLNAADKIGLDAKTHEAMTHLANQGKEGLPPELTSGVWRYSPEYQAERAGLGLNKNLSTEYYIRHLNNLRQEVKRRNPETLDDMVDESILRHHHRAMYKWAKDHNTMGHSLVESHNEDSLKPIKDITPRLRESSKATRYKKNNHTTSLKKYSLANKSKEYSKYTKSINYTRYGDPEQSAWWMDPKGNMHELDDDTDDHAGWIKRHGELVKDDGSGDGVLTRAFKSGWTRLYKMKDTLHVNNPKKILSQPQLWSLKDHALINKIKQLYIYGPPGTKQQIRLSRPKRYSLANKSNFIGALLKASSPEHKMFVQRTSELARRIGASKTKQFPALHDTPNQSVPGVAMAVYGHIQPNAAHALGSWVNGLLPNGPGYAVFHTRPMGIDRLYRLRMDGSGYDARMKLDRAGISSRLFVPHKKGLDVLIPDKGDKMGNTIQSFAQQQKVPIEMSTGHFSVVGSQDQAQARSTFRNKVVQHESGQTNFQKRRIIKRYASKPPVPKYRGGEIGYDPKPKVNSVINHAPENSFGASMDEIYADRRGKGPQPIWDDERIAKRDAKRKKQNNYPIEKQDGITQDIRKTLGIDTTPNPEQEIEQNRYKYPQTDDKEDYYHEPAYDKIEEPSPSKLPFKGVPQGSIPVIPGISGKIEKPVVPKKTNTAKNNRKLFNPGEYNRLHAWAHKHAFTHTPAFAKFLGSSNARDPKIHELLVKHIIDAAHEMRRTGNKSIVSAIGKTGKRIKINIPYRTHWNDYKKDSGTYKLPKDKKPIKEQRFTNRLTKYERRRDFILSFSRN